MNVLSDDVMVFDDDVVGSVLFDDVVVFDGNVVDFRCVDEFEGSDVRVPAVAG
jgi:hypothetical protein